MAGLGGVPILGDSGGDDRFLYAGLVLGAMTFIVKRAAESPEVKAGSLPGSVLVYGTMVLLAAAAICGGLWLASLP